MGQALHRRSAKRAKTNGLLPRIVTVFASALLIFLSQPAAADPPMPRESKPLVQRGKAWPTPAWKEFCERLPQECTVDTQERTIIALTMESWAAIVAVNLKVNTQVRPITDREHWNLEDRWDFPDDGSGDCEDYQLLKRKLLIEAGFPRRALRMTVVIDDENAGHAVMMVRTDRGDFILDNKRDAVLSWRDTGYAFVKREGQDSKAWVSLETVASPIVTANR